MCDLWFTQTRTYLQPTAVDAYTKPCLKPYIQNSEPHAVTDAAVVASLLSTSEAIMVEAPQLLLVSVWFDILSVTVQHPVSHCFSSCQSLISSY